MSGQFHHPTALPWERAPGTHWIGGWVGPRAGLDVVEKKKLLTLPGLELRPLGRPVRSQSLYRLRYASSKDWFRHSKINGGGGEFRVRQHSELICLL
jgi:hypothetical protein